MTVAIEARRRVDRRAIEAALARLKSEDPSFNVSADADTGQIILGGTGELQLDAKIDALRRAGRLDIVVGAPQVGYRETISHPSEVDYTHKRIGGDGGRFARVALRMSPLAIGEAAAFASTIAPDAMPAEFVAGAHRGVAEALSAGVVAGFPVVSVKVELRDSAFHDADSSPAAFEIAARTACRDALLKGGAVLLEPVMTVEVMTPRDRADAVVADMLSRRGRIGDRRLDGESAIVTASAPLANLFGYVDTLRSITRGRATCETRYDHYAVVPPRIDPDPPEAPAVALRLSDSGR